MQSRNDSNSDSITHVGSVRFVSFEAAFKALYHHHHDLHSGIVSFSHIWFTDWTNRPDEINIENGFLVSMLDSLNDDCEAQVLKFLNPLQLQYINKRNEKISYIITTKLPSAMLHVKITMESVGFIGIMNFNIYNILYLIKTLARNVKKLYLVGFDPESEVNGVLNYTVAGVKVKTIIDSIKAEGEQIVY